MAAESSLNKKSPCAFCGDYTELVRVCLTPQCESCQIDRELQPDLPCLPECSFLHSVELKSSNNLISPSRQVQLLRILAQVFYQKLLTLINQVRADLGKIWANVQLAQLYQRFGLVTTSTVKEQNLILEQLQFQLDQSQTGLDNTSRVLTAATETDQLYRQIDHVETFLTHYVAIPASPLLLSYQVVPEASDILDLSLFLPRDPVQRPYQPQLNVMYPLNLLPGVEDDIIMLTNYVSSSPYLGRLYYNLTRREKFMVASHGLETSPEWLPHYYADFTAGDFVAFSQTGVWLYYDEELIHRILIDGLIPPGQRDPGFYRPIRTPRPWLLTSRGNKMIMLTLTDNGAIYSAWLLTQAPNTIKKAWLKVSSYRLQSTYGFYGLAFTTGSVVDSVNDPKVIIAERYRDQIIVTVLDFTTGQVCHQANFATVSLTVDEIDYMAVIDDCIHVVARHNTKTIDYHVYSLTGQLLVKRDDLPDWNDEAGIPPLAVVKTKQGQIKICY